MGFTIAIGPIAAVVLVGVVTSMALSALDEHYGITNRVIAGIDDISEGVDSKLERAKEAFYKKASDLAGSVFDYAIDSAKAILINTAKHTLDEFLSGRPRL